MISHNFGSRSISCNITESEFWSRLSINIKWDQKHFLITLGSGVSKSLSLDSEISWKSLPHNLGVEEVRSTRLAVMEHWWVVQFILSLSVDES